jgi:transposase InsO family protein/transposase-like protein
MKLTYEDKLEIYRLWKHEGYGKRRLAKRFGTSGSGVIYICRLIDRHGPEAVRHGKYKKYSKEFKEAAIRRVLILNESAISVSLDLGLSNWGMLANWIKPYIENGYTVVERKRGRHARKETEDGKGIRSRDQSPQGRESEAYDRERIHKKIECLSLTKRKPTKEEIAAVISELRQQLKVSLRFILEVINDHPRLPKISKSDYYYVLSKKDKDLKNDEAMNKIIAIYYHHKGRYGYRRIHLQLLKEGYRINHKKVQRLMKRMDLTGIRRNRRRYSSYQGTIGKLADNLIERDFFSDRPDQKWYTDITEFNLRGDKVYLSPILDGYAGDIISYNVSRKPDFLQISDMMDKAFLNHHDTEGLIFHSDQGWQYQMYQFSNILKKHKMIQSMSRKGNSLDNGLMENFFGLLKTEMYYDQEDLYKDTDELIRAIEEYIHYYNNERIKSRLKGLTPIEYRNQALMNP